MRDDRKLRVSVAVFALLCFLSIAYNVASELVLPDIEGYLRRKMYYEGVISRKGLSMHEADYWKKGGAPSGAGDGRPDEGRR